ncbi:Ubiquitin-like protein [Sporothrix stenoceras]|uniref:Ubiquitin-like protein ATG12 n=1 Tax=Sporothrix stenoceras TaxID=5173 RepID=A0ABR3YS15_9PEZI
MSSPSDSPRMRESTLLPRPPQTSAADTATAAVASSPSPSPMPSPSPSSPAPLDGGAGTPDAVDDDAEDYGQPASQDIPLTMTASTVLLNLPRDATAALATAGRFAKDKVVVRFKPVGSAPPLSGGVGGAAADVRRKITSTQKFEVVVAFVRRALKVKESESVFLYINSTFAPALDEVVGNLHQCFKDSHDQLNVSYSLSPAFG